MAHTCTCIYIHASPPTAPKPRLKESVNVSLSAARLGMLTQREILMEELETQARKGLRDQV